MMDKYQRNPECLFCGSGDKPALIEQTVDENSIVHIKCSECGNDILKGLIVRDGVVPETIEDVRVPLSHSEALFIPSTIHFSVWELWWSSYLAAAGFHGKQIIGDSELWDLVESLPIIYDDPTRTST